MALLPFEALCLASVLAVTFEICEIDDEGCQMTRIEAIVAAVFGLVAFVIAYAMFAYEGQRTLASPIPPLYFLTGAALGFLVVRILRNSA